MAEGQSHRNTAASPDPADAASPIWRRRWFQFLLGATAVFIFLSFVLPPIFGLIYAVRSVLTPVVFALVLAYIFNPLVTWLDHKLRLPRWGGTALIMGLGTLVLLISLVVAVPVLVEQGSSLLLKLQEVYPRVIAQVLNEESAEVEPVPLLPPPDATLDSSAVNESGAAEIELLIEAEKDKARTRSAEEASKMVTEAAAEAAEDISATVTGEHESSFGQLLRSEPIRRMIQGSMQFLANLELSALTTATVQTLDIGTGVVGSAISFTTYWLVFVMVAAFSFFFLSWKLDAFMMWFIPFIPIDHRERTLQILGRMDRTVSAWLRGRLVQALLLSIMLTVGWGIAGVPYWFLLGVVSGVLGLVPYLIIIGWGFAILLATLDALSNNTFSWWVLLWPTLVYVIAQTVDGWVVEPLLQGKATEMSTLTVLLVVLIGGTLGGLIGLLIAIPVAACVKILCVELVLPKLRELAAQKSLL